LAVNALTLAACLRPWRGAGIHALLRDGIGCGQGDDAFDDAGQVYGGSQEFRRPDGVARDTEDAAPQPSRNAGLPRRDTQGARRQGATQFDASGAAQAYRDSQGFMQRNAVSYGAPAGDPEGAVPPSFRPSSDNAPPSAGQFSAPWRALLEKTRSAPLVWTYEELGSDLQGNASVERSRCLKALIAQLSLPRGSSAFWPLGLPASAAAGGTDAPASHAHTGETGSAGEDGVVVASGAADGASGTGNAAVCPEFAEGVRLLGAGIILYFGTAAAARSGFSLTTRAPYTQQIAGGLQHILLPALSALGEGPEQADKTVAFLRSVLADHPLLRARATKGDAV
jgi:hypothetical protein